MSVSGASGQERSHSEVAGVQRGERSRRGGAAVPLEGAAINKLPIMRFLRLRSMQSLHQRMQRVVVRRQELAQRWDALRNNDLFQLLVVTLPDLLRAERCAVFVPVVERAPHLAAERVDVGAVPVEDGASVIWA